MARQSPERRAPANDMDWEKVQANAFALAQAGNLLMIGMAAREGV